MTKYRTLPRPLVAVVILALAVVASGTPDGPIQAVATFSVLGDMVSRIGGEHVAVTTLVGSEGDTHVYKPTPAAARAVSQAHLLVVNGLDFEGWLDRLIEASDFGGVRVVATAGIEPVTLEMDRDHDPGHGNGESVEGRSGEHHEHEHEHEHGAVDPHAWQSLRHAVTYVDNITEALAKADPENANTFRRNRTDYVAEIEALDAELRAMFDDLPPGSRTIITSHDAFRYFGHDYGLTFIAPQGVTTASEASAQDVARLIELIRDQGIRAVFPENVADPRLLKRIAEETGATVGGTLYPSTLSGPDGPAPTYLDMMRHNARTLAQALLK
ncbi:MAG: zinc ABC transporter substrate-binding protein [Candidatus Tectomicrobia bacterium]|nr:zinc ABC transporter substrate-binding protein [Candidatus Tectomicrobia bacterium]